MLKKLWMTFLFVVVIIASSAIFQNCSGVDFNSPPKNDFENNSGNGDRDPLTEVNDNNDNITEVDANTFTQTKTFEFNSKTDILFVLDDSCTMSEIIQNVKQGIESIQSVTFPQDTKMAVTYMSPVKLDSDSGTPLFDQPYYAHAKTTPGHIQLVSKTSIDNFVNMVSDNKNVKRAQSRFSLQGCEASWFTPQSANDSGESCLSAAMQIPLLCTKVEAGTTSLFQLIQKSNMMNKKLFRDKTNLHILFVSDTHDAGENYYGIKDHNPDRMPSLEEIRSEILINNPNIQSIRFNGIVPLPPANDDRTLDLQVIGDLPENLSESKVSSEELHDFSYLDYIKDSKGVAVHAGATDWSTAMEELITSALTPSSVFVALSEPASQIEVVKVNESVLSESDYSLSSDKKNLEIQFSFKTNQPYEVFVRFKTP